MANNRRLLVIDPAFGMAGDMMSAALISAGARDDKVIAAMKLAASSLGDTTIEAVGETRSGVEGIYLNIRLLNNEHAIDASVAAEHLVNAIGKAGISKPYAEFALTAMKILTEAEYAVHHNDSARLHTPHLHEAQDIIIDLAGAAMGLQLLGIDCETVTCLSPVMVGGGTIRFSHGELDVPAPATAYIIRNYGIPIRKGPVEKELFTPTGAAIMAALNPRFAGRTGFSLPPGESGIHGTGFGSMRLPSNMGSANALSLIVVESP
ncbi:MAG: DUF111 family protein [Spirochaetales bacterium]|nr:DUF111 family protein [Spirochaetales bacterium]